MKIRTASTRTFEKGFRFRATSTRRIRPVLAVIRLIAWDAGHYPGDFIVCRSSSRAMPDQDRRAQFLHSLGHGLESGKRCSSCPAFRVTYQADCVCCGRKVDHHEFSKVDAGKAPMNMKRETSTETYPLLVSQPLAQGNQAPHCRRAGRRRHKLCSIPILRTANSFQSRPCAEIGDRVRSMTTLSGGFKNSKLISQQPNQVVVRSSSSRLSKYVHQRNLGKLSAVKVGGHHEFRGVRTRKGVKGFLVEIRPPRWKRTIWLGTYSTDFEAAGAFDAGVFYTNKPDKKYNFRDLEREFPPLPPHLRLDNAESMNEIKCFVQKQAKEAAAAARRMWNNGVQLHQDESVKEMSEAEVADTDTSNESSELSSLSEDLPKTAEVGFEGEYGDMPLDMEYLRGAQESDDWIDELMLEQDGLPQL